MQVVGTDISAQAVRPDTAHSSCLSSPTAFPGIFPRDSSPNSPQTQVFKNAHAVLTASSSSPSHVLKSTVFLKSMDDFAEFNKLYEGFFGGSKPARSCVEVSRLPKDVLVEME